MSFAIRVENLSKRYRLCRPGSAAAPYRTLREDLSRLASAPLGWLRRRRAHAEEFWALRGIDFEVRPGERVGIIGRNGAGKSTLLKVLSRITRPTGGRARLRGRLASLLEVGTGFHPELSGRENIYLSAAIQGMGREQVRRQFDDIVAFAEVEPFLDTPVKRYSSGMYVRLAFAVAAHLDPEIFLIDEVLAVGDAGFQRKCVSRMDATARDGRTVLFVSHNMQLVRSLCDRAILLEAGKVTRDAPAEQVLPAYLQSLRGAAAVGTIGNRDRLNRTSGDVRFESIDARGVDGQSRWIVSAGDTVRLVFAYRAERPVPSLGFYLALRSGLSNETITTFKGVVSEGSVQASARGEVTVELPDLPLRPGDYSLYACLGNAAVTRFYDVVDENVNLPWIVVTSEEEDVHRLMGFVSLPHRMTVTSTVGAQAGPAVA